jgi:hypothetical protein
MFEKRENQKVNGQRDDWDKMYSVANLLKELQTNKPQDLQTYSHMNSELFQNLLNLIQLRVKKRTYSLEML